MPEIVYCNSCGAPIFWVTLPAQTRLPVNPEPSPSGNVILIDHPLSPDHPNWNQRGMVMGRAQLRNPRIVSPDRPRYVSHFATCPNAGKHRKGK